MAWWSLGLGMQRRAVSAAKWGAVASIVQAARMTVGNVVSLASADKPWDNAIVWFIGASLIPFLFLVAGLLLWRGRGLILGSLAVLITLFDTGMFGPQMSSIQSAVTLAIRCVLLLLTANGVRGALALKKIDYRSDGLAASALS